MGTRTMIGVKSDKWFEVNSDTNGKKILQQQIVLLLREWLRKWLVKPNRLRARPRPTIAPKIGVYISHMILEGQMGHQTVPLIVQIYPI